MERIKALLIGIFVVIYNLGVSLSQVIRPERCNGNCGACGLSCVAPVIGLAGIGFIIIMFRKLKGRVRRLKAKLINFAIERGYRH